MLASAAPSPAARGVAVPAGVARDGAIAAPHILQNLIPATLRKPHAVQVFGPADSGDGAEAGVAAVCEPSVHGPAGDPGTPIEAAAGGAGAGGTAADWTAAGVAGPGGATAAGADAPTTLATDAAVGVDDRADGSGVAGVAAKAPPRPPASARRCPHC
jgi:hypothetical protein